MLLKSKTCSAEIIYNSQFFMEKTETREITTQLKYV